MTHQKKLHRREFAKLAGGAALAVPAGIAALSAEALAGQAQGARPERTLSAEQEERVRQARERNERQLRGLREQPIPYDAEPALVFRARTGKKRS